MPAFESTRSNVFSGRFRVRSLAEGAMKGILIAPDDRSGRFITMHGAHQFVARTHALATWGMVDVIVIDRGGRP